MDFTNTLTLLAAIEEVPKEATFLRDRYFPTNASTDIFATDEVLVEYKDGDKKLAPFVSPRKNGVSVFREGYEIHKFEPANIAPKTGPNARQAVRSKRSQTSTQTATSMTCTP